MSTPTAPLPPAAVDALARLELALVVAPRLEACVSRYRQLATHADTLCSAEFDRMLCAVDEMGHCRQQLAAPPPAQDGVVMVSRVELDEQDRGSVERVRQTLGKSERLDAGTATPQELAMTIGSLQSAVDILLRIIDGGAR